ncbi:MAG: reverse transcriptase domain-containing protein [Gloeomargaritales cyanobacterium]
MSIVLGLKTKQVDYSNAFAQAKLKTPIHMEMPQGFGLPGYEQADNVLLLYMSLYGLRQAAERWFDTLSKALIKRGFRQSKIDSCLFFHDKMICIIYIDDCLFFAPEESDIGDMIKSLRKEFELVVEQDVTAYLGIEINKKEDGRIEMTQPGLIKKILEATMMMDCNTRETPALTSPLHKDEHGSPRVESWSYASIIGMMMFLQANTRSDISYAVHQCARFSHFAKKSHETAVKQICRYLKNTMDKGILFSPSGDFKLDCYVDADFAGLWGHEDSQDPISTRSRTGYVLIFAGCPILWVSKLQTEIALSTTEAEYVALSQSMRDVLPTQRLIIEILAFFKCTLEDTTTRSTVFEDNAGALTLAHTPAMTARSKHYGIKYHFFREHVRKGTVAIKKVNTELQKADIFTKGLGAIKFRELRRLLIGW